MVMMPTNPTRRDDIEAAEHEDDLWEMLMEADEAIAYFPIGMDDEETILPSDEWREWDARKNAILAEMEKRGILDDDE